ncbi:hypothetical protein N9H54_02530, partial [Gammaproteobacteria bacterium]|nr:hypothetical protein [Gammaproteobacteria bacterium]
MVKLKDKFFILSWDRAVTNFSYTPNARATVEPEMPGSSSATPTKKPANINLTLSFTSHCHLEMFLGALAQKLLHHEDLLEFLL